MFIFLDICKLADCKTCVLHVPVYCKLLRQIGCNADNKQSAGGTHWIEQHLWNCRCFGSRIRTGMVMRIMDFLQESSLRSQGCSPTARKVVGGVQDCIGFSQSKCQEVDSLIHESIPKGVTHLWKGAKEWSRLYYSLRDKHDASNGLPL